MNDSLRWRAILALIVLAFGVLYLMPSLPGIKDSGLAKYLPGGSIGLGLDLKGGIHLTLGVDVQKALENSASRLGQDLKNAARESEVILLGPTMLSGNRIELVLVKPEQQEQLDKILKDQFNVLIVEGRRTSDDGRVAYTLAITPEYRTRLAKMTMDQAIKTIRNRIDQFGVAEPDIRRQQDDRIQVQLPGLSDPDRAIQIIGKTAHLEFKIADDQANVENAKKGVLPPGREMKSLLHKKPDGTYAETPIVLLKDAVLTGEYLVDARTNFDQFNQAYVTIEFNPRGARIFERITGENVNKRLAIVLDGKVYSAPNINEKISGGKASITGRFTTEEAHDLAIVLRAGSLPAPVTVLEQRTVGPSLGQESIDKGVFASLVGAAVVVVFMVLYYGMSGLVADMVLCMNMVLLLAGMAAFGATLTLPGIAGIALTVGMAVDANVLIYERIREELRRGLTAKAAVQEGYSRATLTILDSNVTTIIAAVILYQFGTGPVRGFAVTLTLGILSSMFTAIFVSRIIFDLYLSKRGPEAKLSI